jgi:Spy/CpxP family protein refolding chaperone
MKKTFLAAAVVAVGLAAAVPFLNAQDQPPQTQGERVGPRGHRGFGGPGGPMGRGGRMGGPLAGGLRDLSDAQRAQVKAIHDKHAAQIEPLIQRARTAREALDTAIMSGNTANLQALSIEVGNAETELTFAQAQVQAEVYNILTAEQKQRIAERRKEMAARRAEMLKRRQGQGQTQ